MTALMASGAAWPLGTRRLHVSRDRSFPRTAQVKLAEKETRELCRRMRLGATAARAVGSATDGSHYSRVAALHIGATDEFASEIGREALKEIHELLNIEVPHDESKLTWPWRHGVEASRALRSPEES